MNARSSKHRLSLRAVPASGYIFLGVFVLRLWVLGRLADSPFLLPARGDMHFYNDWALRILQGDLSDGRAFYGLPLYAYLLAGIYALFGFSPFIPGLIQAALEGGTAAMLFKIGRNVFQRAADRPPPDPCGTAVGLIAAAGWAFYLPAQTYSIILMPTAWLVFVFWWIVWQIVQRTATPTGTWFLLLGLLIGITAMGVATILFLVPLVLATLFTRWAAERPLASRPRAAVAAVALLGCGIVAGTAPAWGHNRFITGDAVFLSAHSGVNLWIGNNPEASGYPRFPLGLRAGQQAMLADSITGAEAAAGRPLKRSEVSAFWSAKAKAYITNAPWAWLKLIGTKIANFWNSFEYDDLSVITTLRELGITLPGLRFGLVAAFALPGAVFAVGAFPKSRWVLAAVLLHMAALLSVFITERYRLAAVPGLMLFAAFGVTSLWQSVAGQNHGRAAMCIFLVFCAAWLVSVRRGDVELWALEPYNSGLHALESQRLDVAEEKLRRAYAYVPHNAELNFALGNLHLARGERDAARQFYARTLELDDQHKGACNNLGLLALEENQADKAVHLFERALALEPNEPKTLYLLARALFATGRTAEASERIDAALRLRPEQREFQELRDRISQSRL